MENAISFIFFKNGEAKLFLLVNSKIDLKNEPVRSLIFNTNNVLMEKTSTYF